MNDTEIVSVTGRRRWDSRGRPTVEAEVCTASGATGRALAPAGASTGRGEALDLRDGGPRLGGFDVGAALANINGEIAAALAGTDAADQLIADAALENLDPTESFCRLGGNATVAVSMAVAAAAAAARHLPLWAHLDPGATVVPMPQIQIFGGGAHANGRIDIQDLMVVPVGAASFGEALEWVAEIYLAAGRRLERAGRRAGVADEGGWWPAFDTNAAAIEALVAAIEDAGFTPASQVGIALDLAATQFFQDGGYRLARDRRTVDADGLCALICGWVDRYPIVSIEDPFAETDTAGMAAFTAAVGDRIQVVGDDFLVTDAGRVEAAAAARAANAVLIKPNQAGTLTRARAALDAARRHGWATIVSARSGETEDVTVAHLAVGWSAGQLKVGSIARGERTAKWNEVLRIAERLGATARLGTLGR
jgi:enolase